MWRRSSSRSMCVVVCRHDVVQREVKDLEKGIAHLHNCMARYNALIADNAHLKVQLVNDNFHLETRIGHELQVHLPSTVIITVFPHTLAAQYVQNLVKKRRSILQATAGAVGMVTA